MISTVILDFDDTLFMTELVGWHRENEAARRIGMAPMSHETHLANWGDPVAEAIPTRLPGVDVEAFLEAYAQVFHEQAQAGEVDQLTARNLRALSWLRRQGYGLYAVTSRHVVELEHLLDSDHDLAEYVHEHHIFHRDNNPYHKPDPRAFDAVLRLAEVAPEECLYVGDSLTDCQAAKGAGLSFVACLESGLRRRQEFEAQHPAPDGYIDTFAELPQWLQAAVPAKR
jgi:phosphoglycolate phosphatase